MTIRSSCELETYIVAVERIKEYTELPSEVSKNNCEFHFMLADDVSLSVNISVAVVFQLYFCLIV